MKINKTKVGFDNKTPLLLTNCTPTTHFCAESMYDALENTQQT